MSDSIHLGPQLLEFLREGIFPPDVSVNEDTDLIANGFDSMALVSLLLFVERTCGIWIPQDELNEANLKTPRALTEAISRLLDERKPSP